MAGPVAPRLQTAPSQLRRQLLAALAGALPLAAFAQPRAGPKRVGMLFFGAPSPGGEPIVRELARLGWQQGRTIAYEMRYAMGRRESYPALAAELGAASLDSLFCIGSDVLGALKPVSVTTPVVFVVSDDPVATGMVASLSRPGGRLTGVSFMSPQLAAKRLELLAELVPELRRVAVLTDPGHDALYVPEFVRAANATRIEPVPIRFDSAADFPAAFARARSERADAMFVVPSRYTLAFAREIGALTVEHRLPAICAYDSFARNGGLISYGPTGQEAIERAAAMLDRVLKGAQPADIPVEQASRIALIVNARTAEAMQLRLPDSVLVRATEVLR